jgi:RimJ/RimL family protein N-acetyltransferase
VLGDSDDILTPDTSHLAPSVITFRALAEADLPLVHAWLNNPEVARWYGLGFENQTSPSLEDVKAYYAARMVEEAPVILYIIQLSGRPVGFIQTYRIGDHKDYARALDFDNDARGIDLFIGEDDVRGGGFGTRVIERFLEAEVFSRPGVATAVLAPDPDNARGIRCYEKAGFRHVKTVWVEVEQSDEYVMARKKFAKRPK